MTDRGSVRMDERMVDIFFLFSFSFSFSFFVVVDYLASVPSHCVGRRGDGEVCGRGTESGASHAGHG
jgi:hypothetical protein